MHNYYKYPVRKTFATRIQDRQDTIRAASASVGSPVLPVSAIFALILFAIATSRLDGLHVVVGHPDRTTPAKANGASSRDPSQASTSTTEPRQTVSHNPAHQTIAEKKTNNSIDRVRQRIRKAKDGNAKADPTMLTKLDGEHQKLQYQRSDAEDASKVDKELDNDDDEAAAVIEDVGDRRNARLRRAMLARREQDAVNVYNAMTGPYWSVYAQDFRSPNIYEQYEEWYSQYLMWARASGMLRD